MENAFSVDWRGRTILLVVRSLEMGGTQRQVAGYLAPWLQNRCGARVVVLALECGGPWAATLERQGIACRLQGGVLESRGIRKLVALWRLVRTIRGVKPDAILSFNDFPNKVCGAIWKWTGARVCIWNQRDEGREVTGRFLERRALRRVPLFIANSRQGQQFLTERFAVGPDRIRIIPNAVALASPVLDRAAWRRQLAIPSSALVTVMVANLHRYKDHDTLLRAWALVLARTDGGDLHLVLAGKAVDTAGVLLDLAAELKITGRVHFPGGLDDIPGVLAASDIGVFSSRCEGMPNGVLECMAAGLPLAATEIIGIREALGSDYPLLVPPRDAEALARALLELNRDAELRRLLGERNRLRAGDEFSVERLGRRFVETLRPYLD